MSNDYDAVYAAAREGSPFSNGTEGYAWMANWCDRCSKNDEQTELWCPLLSVALLGRTPVEWIEQPWGERGPSLSDRYHCTQFSPRDDDGDDPEPEPGPTLPPFVEEMPGQVDIFSLFAEDIAEQVEQISVVTA